MRIFFIVNYAIDSAVKKAGEAIKKLKDLNCFCSVESSKVEMFNNFTSGDSLDNLNKYDLIISVGGDGTIISAAKFAVQHNLPILGINAGHMGFLCGMQGDEIDSLSKLVSEEYFVRKRMLLEIVYESRKWIAVNDAVITKPTYHGFVNLKVYDNEDFVINYRADSVLFSTPVGSTAYSLSNGGPISDPSLKFIAMSPICAHSLISRTNLFSEKSVLNVQIGSENEACLILDGVAVKIIKQNSKVQIKKSEKNLKLIYLKDIHFFELVKNKFFN